MQQLIEQSGENIDVGPTRRRGRAWPVIAVLAMLIGAGVGWAIGSSAHDEREPLVVVGDTDITERQQAMIDTSERLLAAYQANDADAILAEFTSRGAKYVVGDGTYRVDDGSLRAFVESRDFSGMEMIEPMTIHENDVTMVVRVDGNEWLNVFVFTPSGDVLVTDHLSFGP